MIKSKSQKIAELLNAVDRNKLKEKGISLVNFVKQDFSSPDKPKSQSDIKLEKALYKLHHLKIRMYESGQLK
jgi:hypothetical protein